MQTLSSQKTQECDKPTKLIETLRTEVPTLAEDKSVVKMKDFTMPLNQPHDKTEKSVPELQPAPFAESKLDQTRLSMDCRRSIGKDDLLRTNLNLTSPATKSYRAKKQRICELLSQVIE
jgi:hypothetical protein